MKYLKRFIFLSSVALISLSFQGCGGSDYIDWNTPDVNNPPVADGGEDKTVEVGTVVTLEGVGTDSDGYIVSYYWEEGSTILAETATFDYVPMTVGDHLLDFCVTDDDGALNCDRIVVTANPAT